MTLAAQLEALVGDMLQKGITLEMALREFERRYIARALDKANGCKSDAAKLLGVHRNTLASRLTNHTGAKSSRRGRRKGRRR